MILRTNFKSRDKRIAELEHSVQLLAASAIEQQKMFENLATAVKTHQNFLAEINSAIQADKAAKETKNAPNS